MAVRYSRSNNEQVCFDHPNELPLSRSSVLSFSLSLSLPSICIYLSLSLSLSLSDATFVSFVSETINEDVIVATLLSGRLLCRKKNLVLLQHERTHTAHPPTNKL